MNNGVARTALVTDLLRGDGPYQAIAEDFVVQRCSFCTGAVDNDVRFNEQGYLCTPCLSLEVAV
ncbi:MAG: hypothetical protein GXP36_05240 [Actinobacteria bacterium]|uniref:Uncharacterized protein n=1 Tax=hydrothermal vent metagenome TaxID=652676 RepID=A0A3B0TNY2_9ZZZZ|nr:hypothetical protein [Actinomycetota bacterium]